MSFVPRLILKVIMSLFYKYILIYIIYNTYFYKTICSSRRYLHMLAPGTGSRNSPLAAVLSDLSVRQCKHRMQDILRSLQDIGRLPSVGNSVVDVSILSPFITHV